MAKILVTHINPHLDDIAAIWLFKKFHPEFSDAEIKFISASTTGATLNGDPVDSNPDIQHFGVGRGKYDEHKGDIGKCATSLVWEDIIAQGLAPTDEAEKAGYAEVTEWNRLIDTATFPQMSYDEFTVASFIRPLSGDPADSLEAQLLGEKILDRILRVVVNKNQVRKDWKNKIEFETKWGKAVAVASDAGTRGLLRSLAKEENLTYALFVMTRPKTKTAEFFSDQDGVDLTELDVKIRQMDPEAAWFLHHSKKMLLCGAKAAPDGTPTKLSLDQLMESAKSLS